MTDQLLDHLRRHAADETVPELDLEDVIGRGRRLRRRRSVARRSFVTLVLGAVVGSIVLVGVRGENSPDVGLTVTSRLDESDTRLVSAAYRTGGAFSRGDTLWFSDPDYSVDLGVTIQLMYYTADGVIAGVTDDDAGTARRGYVYVGTDGTVRRLHLPGKVVPGADAQADRFAYVTKRGPGYRIHVVQASTGQELTTRDFEARYTWAGWDVPPVGLTGDYVVVGVDGAQRVINWRTGRRVADVPGVQLPSTGGGHALGSDLGWTTYRVGDSARLRSTKDLAVYSPTDEDLPPWANNELSPDGRYVQTTNTFVSYDEKKRFVGVTDAATGRTISDPRVYVTEVATGHRISLPGHAQTYGWTPDGRLIRVEGSTITTCDAGSGDCTSRRIEVGPGTIRMAGRYLGS